MSSGYPKRQSNRFRKFYLDINETRRLVKMESEQVNQFFLRVSDPSKADAVKTSIQNIIPSASVVNANSFLSLLGTLSRLTGQFQQVTTFVAGLLALLLLVVFLRGAIGERAARSSYPECYWLEPQAS